MAAREHDLNPVGPDQLQEASGCTQVRLTSTQLIKKELLDEGGSKR